MNSTDRLAAVKTLQLKYDPEPFHSNQVTKLALQLFDELSALHGLSVPERLLLEAAALLHDIGYARESDGHHKNSLKMILEYGLPGFNPTEIAIIANVARYHRKSLPAADHNIMLPWNQRPLRSSANWRLCSGLPTDSIAATAVWSMKSNLSSNHAR
jgi:exopolyphosphatase/guanosine-5'-triphosphate,3'-diphosphate pyrophosphatase